LCHGLPSSRRALRAPGFVCGAHPLKFAGVCRLALALVLVAAVRPRLLCCLAYIFTCTQTMRLHNFACRRTAKKGMAVAVAVVDMTAEMAVVDMTAEVAVVDMTTEMAVVDMTVEVCGAALWSGWLVCNSPIRFPWLSQCATQRAP